MPEHVIMRRPKRLITLANPMTNQDGNHFAVEIETENNPTLDVEIPLSRVGEIVKFLVDISTYIRPDTEPKNTPLSPIPIQGLGFVAGNTPDETLLVVRLNGFDLAFLLDSNKVAEFGQGLAQTAQVLSANSSKPQ